MTKQDIIDYLEDLKEEQKSFKYGHHIKISTVIETLEYLLQRSIYETN